MIVLHIIIVSDTKLVLSQLQTEHGGAMPTFNSDFLFNRSSHTVRISAVEMEYHGCTSRQWGLNNGITQQVALAMKIIVVDARAVQDDVGCRVQREKAISATHNLRSDCVYPPTKLKNKDMCITVASFNLWVSTGRRLHWANSISSPLQTGSGCSYTHIDTQRLSISHTHKC